MFTCINFFESNYLDEIIYIVCVAIILYFT